MGKNLVIVESPAKAKTINKILGTGYIVKASMGHVRDLPLKNLGVDIKNGFKPKYVVVQTRKKIIDELKKYADESEIVYLAQDPDREGEAIAWHVKAILERGKKDRVFRRVQYNEITPAAVRKAIEHPRELDQKLVDAQQARRVLDRIVGYTVSPMLWRRIRRGLSAGRVQSVALRIVCEREKEIRSFVPEEFWILGAVVKKLVPPPDPFRIKLAQINGEKADIKNKDQSDNIKADLEGRALKVSGIAIKELSRRAPPPFITSTLQQGASTFCGYSPNRTMSIAQKLYEGVELGEGPVGLITYMRTDSFTVAQEALTASRSFIRANYGDEYCPDQPNYFKNKSSSQEAHEAIRPTDVNRTPESMQSFMDAASLKLYTLIWKRFVASQMTPARISQRTVTVDAPPPAGRTSTYTFRATASEVTFQGFMKVAGTDMPIKDGKEKEDGEEEQVDRLPQVVEGEQLECLEWLADRKETQPPPRFSEAALVRALEADGIGRPSTYAQIITTLINRQYVLLDKRALVPTDLGMQVCDLLVQILGELFNVNFTASMEAKLDEIEDGSVEWSKMMEEFYGQFEKWMAHTKEPPADPQVVRRVLSLLASVKEWGPEVKRGKRTYSDAAFVQSIQKQVDGEEPKPVSARQFDALLSLATRYKTQVQEIEPLLHEIGHGDVLTRAENEPITAATLRKFEILAKLELSEAGRKFIDSLEARIKGGRGLSAAQMGALNNVMVSNTGQIPDFEAIKGELELGDAKREEDPESGPLLEAMDAVKTWNKPVNRGRRVFDDQLFLASLKQHFQRKGSLSEKQRGALKKMLARYREQIQNYDGLADKFGLKK